jgi:hypothetical protein
MSGAYFSVFIYHNASLELMAILKLLWTQISLF